MLVSLRTASFAERLDAVRVTHRILPCYQLPLFCSSFSRSRLI